MPRGIVTPIGTRRLSQNGYWYEKTRDGWQLVSRLVAEEKLGRKLATDEYVGYVDNDRENIEPENIIVRKRGQASVRRRLAQVEARVAEFSALADDLRNRIEVRDSLGNNS
jgi:hypothetical protein